MDSLHEVTGQRDPAVGDDHPRAAVGERDRIGLIEGVQGAVVGQPRVGVAAADRVEEHAVEPVAIPDLDEIDRRSTVYAPFQVMPQRFPEYWQAIQEQRWQDIGWDSFDDFRQRVTAAWDGLVANPPGATVAVACHGGVIGVVLAHVTGLAEPWSFANPPFASFCRVVLGDDGRAQVASLNETGHFDAMRERAVGPDGEGFAEPTATATGAEA